MNGGGTLEEIGRVKDPWVDLSVVIHATRVPTLSQCGGSCQAMRRTQTAHHEAGHAVAAVVLRTGLISVDIKPMQMPGGGIGIGGANLRCPPESILGKGEDDMLRYLITFLAGWLAEGLVCPGAELEYGHPQSDGASVLRYARGAFCVPVLRDGRVVLPGDEVEAKRSRIDALISRAIVEGTSFVARHAGAIGAVATALLHRETLSAREVEELVKANQPT